MCDSAQSKRQNPEDTYIQLRELNYMKGSELRSLRLIQRDCAFTCCWHFCLGCKRTLTLTVVFSQLKLTLSQRKTGMFNRKPPRKIRAIPKELFNYFNVNTDHQWSAYKLNQQQGHVKGTSPEFAPDVQNVWPHTNPSIQIQPKSHLGTLGKKKACGALLRR